MWNRILRLLLGQVGPILNLILTRLTDRHTFDNVLALARSAVAKLEGKDELDGATKRALAEQAILTDLKAIGMDVAMILINLAIELALAELRSRVST